MTCSNCGSSELSTLQTVRLVELDVVKRYRRCRECLHQFITYEGKVLEVIIVPGKRARFMNPEDFEEKLRKSIGKNPFEDVPE